MRKLLLFLLLLVAPTCAFAQGTTTTQITFTPTATAYTAGQCLGPAGASAIITIPGMVRPGGPGGTILTQISITDPTGADAAIDVLLFNALPTGTYTDHAACVVATADQPKLTGVASNALFTCTLDQATVTGICQATPAVLMTAKTPVTSSALYAVLIMRGTPTYGASKTLYVNFKAFPD